MFGVELKKRNLESGEDEKQKRKEKLKDNKDEKNEEI